MMRRRLVGLLFIAVFGFAGGVASTYFFKYRPLRNEVVALRQELKTRKFINDLLWRKYSDLAKLPRFQIKQDLHNVKVKRGSSLDFTPDAYMSVVDSLKNEGDSIVVPLRDTVVRKKSKWSEFWNKIF